jgi:polysaccharide biosynthesis transport protein
MLQRFLPTNTGDHVAGERVTAERGEAESGFEILEALNFVRREWMLIGAVVLIALLVGAVSVSMETPRYTASAQLLLDPRGDKPPVATGGGSTDTNLDLSTVESQISIIRSSVLLKRVVEREGLFDDPEFGDPPATRSRAAVPTVFGFKLWDSPAVEAAPAEPRRREPTASEIIDATEALKGAVGVSRSGQAYVLWVSVTSVDPARAARLANAVAEAYVVDKLDARYEAAKRASTWLGDRLVELRTQLHDSEEAVVQFRDKHGLQQGAGNVTLNQQQLTDLNGKLVAAKAEVADKQARLNMLTSLAAGGNALNLPADFAGFGILQNLRQQDASLSQKEADLLSRYTGQHPLVVNVRAERRDVKRAIDGEVRRLVASVKSDLDLAKARQGALEGSLPGVNGEVGLDNATAISLRELERTAAANKSLYEDFLQKSKVVESQSTFEVKEARVISAALPPGGPSSPKKSQRVMMSLMIGLLLGVGGAFAKEKLNTGFTTVRQVETMLDVPLLTSVSRLNPAECEHNGQAFPVFLVPLLKPLSRHSEMLRALRLGIQMTDVDEPPTIIQMTSALPGEGKTTVSLALAASAAASGLKVLFIDADLRHPVASRLLGLKKGPGLVDLLLSRLDVQDVIQFSERAKIWVLPAGSRSQNPSDLLASDRMKSYMANFKQSFDYIVIDSPPLGAVIDPLVTSALADKVVVVVRWAATSRNLVRDAVDQLNTHKKVAGVVFNMVDDRQASRYGAYLSAKAGGRYLDNYYSD